MDCITVSQGQILGVNPGQNERRKLLWLGMPVKLVVQGGDDLGDPVAAISGQALMDDVTAKRRLQDCHQESRRDSLPADIGYQDVQASISVGNEIVIITADAAGGQTGSGHLQPWNSRKLPWKEVGLNLSGDLDLLFPAVLFR